MSVLLVPSLKKGNGTGHLQRCINICAAVEDARLYLPLIPSSLDPAAVDRMIPEGISRKIIREEGALGTFSFILLDQRSTTKEELRFYSAKGEVIGLDEGGTERNRFDYLIDTLPLPGSIHPPNYASRALLALPEKKREGPPGIKKALIVFGGEDPLHTGPPLAEALISAGIFSAEQITVVQGPAASEDDLPEGVHVLRRPRDLKEQFYLFDVVFTSFGLIPYEAAAAGCAAICIHHSRYHSRLGRIAGFPSAGTNGRWNIGKIQRFLETPELLFEKTRKALGDISGPSLTQFLEAMRPAAVHACPFCGSRSNTARYRSMKRSIFYCQQCGIYYQSLFSDTAGRYTSDYFFSEYRRQYGRTYLEDFDNIIRLSEPRIAAIEKIAGGGKTLLDVGCAYGAFLSLAADRGFSSCGMDISGEAAAYVRDVLHLPALQADFSAADTDSGFLFESRSFEVITMWYVLEHFPDPHGILMKVLAFLAPGGVFAFSTPNGKGISARRSIRRFLAHSPEDHFTVFTPRGVKRILRKMGLRTVKIRITGHHPERIWKGAERYPVLGKTIGLLSRVLGAGDTFEVYAVKDKEEKTT